uniref:Uncharacterized protein n=1 Tax=Glossina pallidipes TaxID=7398 RepID=A0A1B0A1U0_GLOPL
MRGEKLCPIDTQRLFFDYTEGMLLRTREEGTRRGRERLNRQKCLKLYKIFVHPVRKESRIAKHTGEWIK